MHTEAKDFFENAKLYSLYDGFVFTQEGVDWYSQYYCSELPYEKCKRKQEKED